MKFWFLLCVGSLGPLIANAKYQKEFSPFLVVVIFGNSLSQMGLFNRHIPTSFPPRSDAYVKKRPKAGKDRFNVQTWLIHLSCLVTQIKFLLGKKLHASVCGYVTSLANNMFKTQTYPDCSVHSLLSTHILKLIFL